MEDVLTAKNYTAAKQKQEKISAADLAVRDVP